MNSLHYYNEIEPSAIARLRNLMAMGFIPAGDIDTRSIEDVRPSDLAGYVHCHFFAGIGGWPLALALAGWPVDRPVWTGSCPCQPFSQAGKGAGFEDERHLWPAWQHHIAQCRPAVVFGEQVASKDADAWIDLVHADVEGMAYAFGCVPFPAAGVCAPHIRERNYWAADLCGEGLAQRIGDGRVQCETVGASAREAAIGDRIVSWLANTNGRNSSAEREQRSRQQRQQPQDSRAMRLANTDSIAGGQGSAVNGGRDSRSDAEVRSGLGCNVMSGRQQSGPLDGFWADADWLLCTDGKWRPVEPGTLPLAHGLPKGMGKLGPRLRELAAMAGLDARSLRAAKAYRRAELHGQGNAIVPQQAAVFIRAYCEARGLNLNEHAESEAA